MTLWAEMLDPESQIQDTETKVFVGAPLNIVQDSLALIGDATPTNASTTLAVAYPAIHGSDADADLAGGITSPWTVLYLTNGTSFLSTGAVLVNDAVWFSYSSKTLITGSVYRLNGLTPLNGQWSSVGGYIANGSTVGQWWEITDTSMQGTLDGKVDANTFSWELQLDGNQWNSQIVYQDASILVQQRQYSGTTGEWTSWRDVFVGYMDTPEITATPDGRKLWRINARGKRKYLEVMPVTAGTFGEDSVTCTYTASSSLGQAQAETRFGNNRGYDYQPARAGDGYMDTAWVSLGTPGRTQLAPHPSIIGGSGSSWVPSANSIAISEGGQRIWPTDNWCARIQQIYCSGREGDRLTRQMQTWIEIYNFNQYSDAASERAIDYGAFIIENNFGQRIYLGHINGGGRNRQVFDAQTSLILCYDEKTFREQHPIPEGTTVFQYKNCDGWYGSGTKNRTPMRGAGAIFRIDPAGGWLAIRASRGGNLGIVADCTEAGDTPASTFVEPWIDFVAWGDYTNAALGGGLPTFWSRTSDTTDTYDVQGGYTLDVDVYPYTWEPWRSPYTAVSPNGIGSGRSIRRTEHDDVGPASSPAGTASSVSCMGGGTYAVDVDSDGGYDIRNFDSNTSADWSEGAPVIGNRDVLSSSEWLMATQSEFAAPVVVSHSGTTIEVDDATNFSQASDAYRQAVLTSQTIADGRRIAFWYTSRDATHLYGVTFPAAYGSPTLAADTTLTLYVDVTNGGSTRAIYEPVNIRPIYAIKWAIYSPEGSPPYPTEYRIRVTGWSDPADHTTYLGDSFQWQEIVHVTGNTATSGIHGVPWINSRVPSFIRSAVMEFDHMSDDGRAAECELQLLPWPYDRDDAPNGKSWGFSVSDVVNRVFSLAGIPANQRDCFGGSVVNSLRVSEGQVWQTAASLAKRAGCMVGETRMGILRFFPDPRVPSGNNNLSPRLVITKAVARDQIKMREAARHQAGQVQVVAQDVAAGLEYVASVPPSSSRPALGTTLKITDRYAGSASEAVTIATNELFRANRGHTVEVNIGGFSDFELLDLMRIDGVPIDTAGTLIVQRDYFVKGARMQFGGQGMQVTVTLEERGVLA